MKKTVIGFSVIMSLVVIFNTNLCANYPISVGPFIGLKGGVNAASVPWQNYNGFSLSNMPELGVSSYFPFAKDVFFGGGLNLSYSTYGFLTRFNNDFTEIRTTHQYNYFSFSPYLYAKGFTLGMNIGIPLGGTKENKTGTLEINSDEFTTLVDIKLGGVITVYSNDVGRFNIMLEGSYALSGLMNKNYQDDYNYHPAQMWFGINYMFNLQKPDFNE